MNGARAMAGAFVVMMAGVAGVASVANAENAASRASRAFREAIDLAAKGETAKALDAYGQAAALLPHWYLPFLERAALRLKMAGDIDAVFGDLTRAVELKPDAPEVHLYLGLAEMKANQPRKAVSHFERALSISATDQRASDELKRARTALSRLDDEEQAKRRQAEKATARAGKSRDSRVAVVLPATAPAASSTEKPVPPGAAECEPTPEPERTLSPAPLPPPISLAERRGRAEDALALVQRGARCAARRRADDAAFAYARAAMLLPHWVVPHAALADVLLEFERSPERADEALRVVARLKPDSPNLDYHLALVAERRGRLDEARDRYRALIEKRANDAAFVRHIKERLSIVETARGFDVDHEVKGDDGPGATPRPLSPPVRVGDDGVAVAAVEDGVPSFEPPLPVAPSSAERQRRTREAQSAFLEAQDAIKVRPSNAIAPLRRATQLAPHWALPHVELGILLTKLGIAARRAEAELLRALDLAPNAVVVHRTLARIYDVSRRDAAAYAHFKKAHSIDPNDLHTANRLAAIELSRGNRGAALAAYERVAELDPTNLAAWANLASLLEAGGRFADAERAFLAVVRLAPRSIAVYLDLARFYERRGDKLRAKQALADVKRLEPPPPKKPKRRALRPLR